MTAKFFSEKGAPTTLEDALGSLRNLTEVDYIAK